MLKTLKPSDIFSWRSPSFKALGIDADQLSEDDLLRLMLEEPRLIRRPLAVVDGQLIVGADRKTLEALLTGE